MRVAVIALVAFCFLLPANAQQQSQPADKPPMDNDAGPPAAAPPAPPPGAPPAQTGPATAPSPARAAAQARNRACRAQGVQKGLRGEALRDSMQVCALEIRLACLKKAIAQKIVGPARRDFIRDCTG